MNKKFNRPYPKHYYYEDQNVYVFCTDGEIDTTYPTYPDTRRITDENVEQVVNEHNAKLQSVINTYGYVRTYDLFKSISELRYDLDMVSKGIISPMQPVVVEDEIKKDDLKNLLRELKELEQVIEEHIDEF